MGRDQSGSVAVETALKFQSTRPHGARPVSCVLSGVVMSFQSTRPHGARLLKGLHLVLSYRAFQSTRPHGARRLGVLISPPVIIVSIHAPAWGATRLCRRRCRRRNCFNPRARMGRDFLAVRSPRPRCLFQSTRPHGARPHTRQYVRAGRCVSIHAPAWGATLSKQVTGRQSLVSIHAPAWGATLSVAGSISATSSFQSTRPHGARLLIQLTICQR